jgi:GNAT superfamily N-acetyltransferase
MTTSAGLKVGRYQIRLRPRSDSDAGFLLQVYGSTREQELALVDWSPEQKDAFLRMQYSAQDRAYSDNYPGAEYQVIVVDDQAAGRLYLHRREREIRLMEIALLPQWRGQGIGTALITNVLAEARSKGWMASIHVETFNPARRCYERLGFKTVAIHGVYELMEWTSDSAAASAPAKPTG